MINYRFSLALSLSVSLFNIRFDHFAWARNKVRNGSKTGGSKQIFFSIFFSIFVISVFCFVLWMESRLTVRQLSMR